MIHPSCCHGDFAIAIQKALETRVRSRYGSRKIGSRFVTRSADAVPVALNDHVQLSGLALSI
jgi:hypothetical protein